MARLFGTDGVRGVAGEDLTAAFALDLATAAARVLGTPDGTRERPLAVIGRDPRVSGEFLESAVAAGLAGSGVDVVRLGVVPTPAVAFLTSDLAADFGVMISASHNPAPDNGIKFFGRGGDKLSEEAEDEIEANLGASAPTVSGGQVGRVTDSDEAVERYVGHLVATLPHSLDGLRVVVDCAHGAATGIAPAALERAGAEVVAVHDRPDGLNINEECGSTHLDALRRAVLEHGADAGIAHDGDADRCLAVAADGSTVDGDQILGILAHELYKAGRLARNTLVLTVMSNLGLRLAMRESGITTVDTPVGDRHVLEAMRAGEYVLGGEQSGHIIMSDHATTGDGLLTGLQLLSAVAANGVALSELATVMTRLPQALVNVRGVDKDRLETSAAVTEAVTLAETELGDSGRVLIRPSGTEPMVRVMVEAAAESHAYQVAERLAGVVRSDLG
ncbi:phosphoglucosamine mutase [Haloactinospora alba]|uniref:Phosphoglucosamine mutase n=1 Tax=Haloactinospora alba TaxID=405555 RepID=A0A543NMF5_9ACTN|nr:phosphoglucosamine mutase [Haloactinospora alba]TQN33011.1 phosphoglucosamine mutase [Haloactinospora alba]